MNLSHLLLHLPLPLGSRNNGNDNSKMWFLGKCDKKQSNYIFNSSLLQFVHK